jgi:hypothetical protein
MLLVRVVQPEPLMVEVSGVIQEPLSLSAFVRSDPIHVKQYADHVWARAVCGTVGVKDEDAVWVTHDEVHPLCFFSSRSEASRTTASASTAMPPSSQKRHAHTVMTADMTTPFRYRTVRGSSQLSNVRRTTGKRCTKRTDVAE